MIIIQELGMLSTQPGFNGMTEGFLELSSQKRTQVVNDPARAESRNIMGFHGNIMGISCPLEIWYLFICIYIYIAIESWSLSSLTCL